MRTQLTPATPFVAYALARKGIGHYVKVAKLDLETEKCNFEAVDTEDGIQWIEKKGYSVPKYSTKVARRHPRMSGTFKFTREDTGEESVSQYDLLACVTKSGDKVHWTHGGAQNSCGTAQFYHMPLTTAKVTCKTCIKQYGTGE